MHDANHPWHEALKKKKTPSLPPQRPTKHQVIIDLLSETALFQVSHTPTSTTLHLPPNVQVTVELFDILRRYLTLHYPNLMENPPYPQEQFPHSRAFHIARTKRPDPNVPST